MKCLPFVKHTVILPARWDARRMTGKLFIVFTV